MFRVLCLLALAVFCDVNGEDCVPEPIEHLLIDRQSILRWNASTNCDDTSYLIYLLQDSTLQHIYHVNETWLDVSMLRSCEQYRMIVMAVSNTVLSPERHIDAIAPATPDTNLTINNLSITQKGDDTVLLEWDMDDKFVPCVEYYRVMHWDGQTSPVDTYTTYNNLILDDIAPCTPYIFTVAPIYSTDMEGGVRSITYETPAHSAHFPSILSITPGVTYADMRWRLPLYHINPCPIKEFILDASPHVNLTIPIHDNPGRPPISVRAFPLRPDTMYMFRVTMVNSGGASTPIQIAIQTLPEDSD